MEEVQHVLMLTLFLHWSSQRDMCSCLRSLFATAMDAWAGSHALFQVLWERSQCLTDQWNFIPVTTLDANAHLVELVEACMDHGHMF